MIITALDCTLKAPKSFFKELNCAVTGSRFRSNTERFRFCARDDVLLFNKRNVFLHSDKLCGVRINNLPMTRSRGAVLWPIDLAHNSECGEL